METIINEKGEKCFICAIKGKAKKATPEEKVRQKLLEELMQKKLIPKEFIWVEVRLSKYGIPDTNERADVVINAEKEDNEELVYVPIVVIECKNEDVPITYKVIKQVENYANKLGVVLYGVTNGVEMDWYLWDTPKEEYIQIVDIPTYQELLLNQGFVPIKNVPYYSTPFKVYGSNFPKRLIPFVDNLSNLFENTSEQMPIVPFDDFEIAKDGGIRAESNNNPVGEPWVGNYRYFIISRKKGYSFSIGFCVYILEHGAYLTVSIDGYGGKTGHHSLQLYLGDWVHLKGDKVEVWHDGTITTGKGRAKNQDMIDMVLANYPHLIRNNRVFLGTLDNSKPFKFSDESIQTFIVDLIKYVLCREKLRRDKK